MVSPVLFYHQDHPVKVEATKTADIMAPNMLTNIVVPFSPWRQPPHPPSTPRKLPHSLDKASSLTGHNTFLITPDPNRRHSRHQQDR